MPGDISTVRCPRANLTVRCPRANLTVRCPRANRGVLGARRNLGGWRILQDDRRVAHRGRVTPVGVEGHRAQRDDREDEKRNDEADAEIHGGAARCPLIPRTAKKGS